MNKELPIFYEFYKGAVKHIFVTLYDEINLKPERI